MSPGPLKINKKEQKGTWKWPCKTLIFLRVTISIHAAKGLFKWDFESEHIN